MTTDAQNENIAGDLARALFAADQPEKVADQATNKAKWDAEREEYVTRARRLMRGLKAKGYTLVKQP